VFVEPRIQSRDHSNVADRRRDLPLRVANPAATLAERPERPLAAERRHLLSMVNALSRRTLDFLKTPVPASVHRAHRRRLAAHRQQLRRTWSGGGRPNRIRDTGAGAQRFRDARPSATLAECPGLSSQTTNRPSWAPSAAYAKLAGHDVRTYADRPSGSGELVDRIRDADIVLNIRATSRFTAEVLGQCPRLRLISIWGTGTDNVDLAAARARGIRVTNTPGVAAIAVAEHTLALILAVAKQLVQVDRQVRQGQWPRAMATQLRGKTLGLIGVGAIGREVAKLAKGIGMRVIAWTFHPAGDAAEWVAFDGVFRQSDVVSIHVRQSPETMGLIHAEHFDLMRPHAIFHQHRARRHREGGRLAERPRNAPDRRRRPRCLRE
jgi:hypothetical protein